MMAFNDHRLSTERNWSPNQIWYNVMNNVNNPLASNNIDNDLDDLESFGEDFQGPNSVSSDTSNNLVVSPIRIPHRKEISSFVYQNIDPNRASPEMGIDIYAEALSAVVQKLEAFGQGES